MQSVDIHVPIKYRMMVPALGNLAGDARDVSLRVEVMARANHFTGNFPRDFKFKVLWVEPQCTQGFIYQFSRFISACVGFIHKTSRSP